jgi:molecular chaperone DnaK
MSRHEVMFGFDFGTTNTLVSLIQPAATKSRGVIQRFLEDNKPIPSVVSFEDGEVEVGRRAHNRLGRAGLGVQGSIVRSPKTLLGKEDIHIDGVRRDPVQIVTHVIEHVRDFVLKTRVGRELEMNQVVATIPVNMDGKRRRLLRAAFRNAGVEIYEFVHEPLAALYGFLRAADNTADLLRRYNNKLVVVFDWGGGTLDITLCRIQGGMLVQLANAGTEEVGGDIFDEDLSHEVEKRALSKRDPLRSIEVTPDARKRLLHQCEQAKIALSSRSTTTVFVPEYFLDDESPDLVVELKREELHGVVGNLVRKGTALIESMLEKDQRLTTSSVDLCLAVGGMVNMPLIKNRLDEMFGPARVHISDSGSSAIADGAAWVAYDRARLRLAKNVELVLARNNILPVLDAGMDMPYAGEVHQKRIDLYCVDPTDGVGKFVLVSPQRPGKNVQAHESRRPLASMTVDVDSKAGPFKERLVLDVAIDEDMVLVARGWSMNRQGKAECEVYDLEFALALPTDGQDQAKEEHHKKTTAESSSKTPGDLAVRSNVAERHDFSLVPGEVMARFHPEALRRDYGDRSSTIQQEEMLYYRPCSYCDRSSNDPACKCATVEPSRKPSTTSHPRRL